MPELFIEKSVDVNVPASTLWKVLTDNTYISQYMFGCNAETDWKPGSPLLWRGAADGKVYVKGHIVSCDAPHLLAYTVIDPNSAIADIPENYLTMTFAIKDRGANACTLDIRQGDYAKVENGQQRHADTVNGNDTWLEGIRKVAEAAMISA
jgi:uncharacterized protein YndB with AHSA1/START domain